MIRLLYSPPPYLHVCIEGEGGAAGGPAARARVSFQHHCLSPRPRQVAVSPLFYMHRTASVIVIAGRDSNHAAVNNHYTAAAEDNVWHIWWVSSATARSVPASI